VFRHPRTVGAAAATGVVALVAALASRLEPNAYPSYDYAFAMASAQDLLAGRTTGYASLYGPVPHPLTLLESLAVVPLGDLAFPVFTAVALLGLGALCWSLARIGTTLASWPVGVLAAVVVFTTPAIFQLAARTYGDVMFAALVAAAIALEVRHRRCGWPVLSLVAVAGLIRPEAWLLAGAYWLFCAPSRSWRDRVGLAALVVIAPVIWVTMDVLLTGDPMHAVATTRSYTERTHSSLTPDTLWVAFEAMTGWPVVGGAVVGAVLAWRRNRPAAAALLFAGAATLLATIAPALLGDSAVLRRFLVLPAAIAALLFALACLGWTSTASRSPAVRVAAVAVTSLVLVVLASTRVGQWDAHREQQARAVELIEHLQGWATAPTPRAYLTEPACWPVRIPGYGYRPYLRFWLDVPPKAVAFQFADMTPVHGVVLLPTAADGYQHLLLAEDGRITRTRVLGGGRFMARYRRVAHSPGWDLYATRACRRSVQQRVAAGQPASR
jgi:hypothetical protein